MVDSWKAYTKAQFVSAVRKARSLRQVLLMLGVSARQSNYKAARRRIRDLDLDTANFCRSGSAYSRGHQTDLEMYFSNAVKITSHLLRMRLLADGIFSHRCKKCKRKTWCDQPIPLELNHIDGNHSNNARKNLELLCPNCHAQTPHYRGRKKGKKLGQT